MEPTSATINIGGETYECPVMEGTEQERALDIGALRAKSGHITLDVGYGNTGSCLSGITYIDGDAGILRYRGYPIQDLALGSDFVETSYLLIYGEFVS